LPTVSGAAGAIARRIPCWSRAKTRHELRRQERAEWNQIAVDRGIVTLADGAAEAGIRGDRLEPVLELPELLRDEAGGLHRGTLLLVQALRSKAAVATGGRGQIEQSEWDRDQERDRDRGKPGTRRHPFH